MLQASLQPKLGEILTRSGQVTPEQLAAALREQTGSDERLGQCLVRLGHLSEDALLAALGDQLRLQRTSLNGVRIPGEIVAVVPADFARKHMVVPFERHDGTLRVATHEPARHRVIEDLRLLSGLEVEEVLTSEREIRDKLVECYDVTVERLIEDLHPENDIGEAHTDPHDIEVMANEPTIINLVNLVISTAVKERASDIHLVPFEKSLELRYRVDGILQVQPPPPKQLQAAVISRIKIMADMNIAERFIPQDGHFQIHHRGTRVDVRVGTMPTIYGESVVMRLLEKDAKVLSPQQLGLDAERASVLQRIVEKPHGIVLATGPTGSGKTTTLYSILHSIYTPTQKFLTIEDPVEYELPGVGQIPVRPARGFTFATGLRAILRQDPDVIMVGEIRDTETAEIAIRAALTGHLVFSTLHTNNAAGAVARLLDMSVEAFLIASSLEGVLAQRLLRTICSECKEEAPLTADVRTQLRTLGLDGAEGTYFRGRGCPACRDTGYRGRTGLFELLVMRNDLRELILQRRPSTEISSLAMKNMMSIREDGVRKAREGITSVEEVLRVAVEETDLS